MKVLFVAKRHPQQRDLIARPYGRFYHLPTELAALGHDVRVQLCSHRRMGSEAIERDGVVWSSHDFFTLGVPRLLRTVESEVRGFRPDWIVGCSDTWAGWLAHRLSRRVGCRLAIDAYDNYEAYMPANLPLHWLWRRAIRAADVVTAAGPQLATRLDSHRRGKAPTTIVPMAADPGFVPRDRMASRIGLGLPVDAPLIGYSGGWARNRGTDILIEVFRLVRAQRQDARLVLTGRPPAHALAEAGVLALGYVDDAQLPLVLSSLDVACVITADSSFGRYSYPAKLCEAMACGTPLVATATDPVRWMLHDDTRFLASVGDAHGIAERVLAQIDERHTGYGTLPTWESGARLFELALLKRQAARL